VGSLLSLSHILLLGIFIGKAIMLEDIIFNLSTNSTYYKNATLSFVVGEQQHQSLYQDMQKYGALPTTSLITS